MASTISFKQTCPSCEALVPIRDPKLVGKKTECPKCKYRFVVEEPGDDEPAKPKKGDKAAKADKGDKGKKGKKGEEGGKKKKKAEGSSSTVLVGAVVGLVAVLALGVGGYFLFFSGPGKAKTSNSNPQAGGGPPPNTGMPQPGPGGPGTIVGTNPTPGIGTNPTPGTNPPGGPFLLAVRKDQIPDISNLLPGDTQTVWNLNLEKAYNSALRAPLFQTPGAFREQDFQKTFGFSLQEVQRVVVGLNAKWVYSVLRTSKPLNVADLTARLNLSQEAPINTHGWFTVRKDLDSFSNALLKGNRPAAGLGLCFADSQTLVLSSPEMIKEFLNLNGEYPLKSQPSNGTAPGTNPGPGQIPGPGGFTPGGPPPGGLTPGGPGGATLPRPGVGGPPPGGGPPMPGVGGPPPGGGPMPGKTPPGPGGATLPMPGIGGGPPPGGGPMPGGPPPGGGVHNPGGPPPMPGIPGPGGPGLPGPGLPGGPGSGTPQPMASGSYLTIDPALKSLLDKAEGDKGVLFSRTIDAKELDETFAEKVFTLPIPGLTLSHALLKEGVAQSKTLITRLALGLQNLTENKIALTVAAESQTEQVARIAEMGFNTALGLANQTGTGMGRPGFPGTGFPGPGGPPPGAGFPGGGMPPGLGGPPPGAGRGGPGVGLPGSGFPGQPGVGGPGTPGGTPAVNPLAQYLKVSVVEKTLVVTFDGPLTDEWYRQIKGRLSSTMLQVKSDADMASTRSRMHDLARATQKYLEAKGAFPRGTVERAPGADAITAFAPDQRLSWVVELLPFLGDDYQALQVDPTRDWTDGPNLLAAQVAIPQLVARARPGDSYRVRFPGRGEELGPTAWVGMAGVGLDAASYKADDPAVARKLGIFGYDRVTKKDAIKDGLGQTILLIQVPAGQRAPWILGGGGTVRGVSEDTECFQPFISAQHPQTKELGTYAIMADGKVRFIKASITPEQFRALCTINGGEKIEDADLNKIAPVVAGTAEGEPATTGASLPQPTNPERPVVTSAALDPVAYRNAQYRFSTQFPKGFKKLDGDAEGRVVAFREDGTGVNINIRCPAARGGDTVETVISELRDGLPKTLENGKKLAEGDLQIGGLPAKWIEVSHTFEGVKLRQVVYVVVKQPTVYMIFCTAKDESFEKSRAQFQEAAQSMRFD